MRTIIKTLHLVVENGVIKIWDGKNINKNLLELETNQFEAAQIIGDAILDYMEK